MKLTGKREARAVVSGNLDLSVIAPCFNEEGNLRALVARTARACSQSDISLEIVLVDDGSSDSTWATIENLAAEFPGLVRGVRHEHNRGIVPSWNSGLQASRAEIACLIDADLQNPPEAIPHLWNRLMTERNEIVQGTRSSIEWDRDGRYLASRGLNRILNLVFRDSARDSKSGFVLGPKQVLVDILDLKSAYDYPQTFVRVAARAKGYSVGEVETLFEPRRAGKSFLAGRRLMLVYLRVLRDIVRARLELGRGARAPVDGRYIPGNRGVQATSSQAHDPMPLGLRLYFKSMPVHAWLLRPRTQDIYEWLRESQWLSPDDLKSLQFVRARRLLWHAYQSVPYYREAFKRVQFHPRNFSSLEDLMQVPLLGKTDVSTNLYMGLFSEGHRKQDMLKVSTSGSTGTPFVTFADRQQLEFRFATTLRCLEWTGWSFGDRQVRLWHQRLGMSPSQVFRERMDAWMMRRTFIPAFELDERNLELLVKTLNRVRPVLIDGYAESLNFLAMYLNSGRNLEFVPKGIVSSAQTLTAQTRRQIEAALGAKVHDKYGAREFSGVAYQCRDSAHKHVMEESYIVEILKEGRPAQPGEVGEIVITDLNNFSVPLIRYRIGDLALAVENATPCACGRGLGQIGDIQGRTQALVHCANGRWLPGTFFAHFFKDYEYLVQFFQVVQERQGSFTLKVVKGKQWTESQWRSMLVHLRDFVGPTEISVDFVDSIPLLQTGKRTPVVSNVKVDFQRL